MNLLRQCKGGEAAFKIIPRNLQVRNMCTISILKQSDWCRLEKSEKSGDAFLLTLTNCNDNHLLNPSRISSITEHLDEARSRATQGSVLITTAEGDHFCDGFDYDGDTDLFKNVVTGLISLPMPTIAAINGSAAGTGLMLGISHDYLTMKSDIGSLHLCHLSMETKLPPYFAALIRSKVGSPLVRRSLLLRDSKFAAKSGTPGLKVAKDGKDAVNVTPESAAKSAHRGSPGPWNWISGKNKADSDMGHKAAKDNNDDVKVADNLKEESISVLDLGIEVAKDGKDAVEAAEELAVKLAKMKCNGEVYAELRKALYPELCKELELTCTTILPKYP